MDKQQEIKILQSLKGGTYFNQFFSSDDIDKMCENIRNDFPIEYNSLFYAKAESLQKTLNDAKKDANRVQRNDSAPLDRHLRRRDGIIR